MRKKNNFNQVNRTAKPMGFIPREDKNALYELLTSEFPCSRPLSLRLVGGYLSSNGVDKSKYGFSRMKDLLAALDYVKISVPKDKSQATLTIIARVTEEAHASAKQLREPEISESAEAVQSDCAAFGKEPPAEIGKELESFAFLGSWHSFLSELAGKARREDWDFADAPVKNRYILKQYIKYTFKRLVHENKVCVSADGQFAAFNTGLLDEYYSDVYACFIPNVGDSRTEWRFAGFCTAGSRGIGKKLVDVFDPLPRPPFYLKNSEDVIFDYTRQLHTDFEHIIIDNIERLPLRFLCDLFSDNARAHGLADGISACRGDERSKMLYAQLKEVVSGDNLLFMRIRSRLEEAIESAKKRVRLNYRTAVPFYFPRENNISLMLPLFLTDENRPDVALVVKQTSSGSCQGQTILTLGQAYIDARLVNNTVDGWLSLSGITARTNTEMRLTAAERNQYSADVALSA